MADLKGGTIIGGYPVCHYGNVLEAINNTATIVDVTLTAAGWKGSSAPFSQTFTVNGVTPNNTVEIIPNANITAAQVTAMASAMIVTGTQAANSVTLKAFGEKPTISLPITVIVK